VETFPGGGSSPVVPINLDTQGNQLPGNQPQGTLVGTSYGPPPADPGDPVIVVNIYQQPGGGGGSGGTRPSSPTCTYYACRSANSCSLRQLNQATCPANQCSSNADCGGSTTTTPPSSSRWSCSVNQKQCHQNTNGAFTSYSSCMAYCNPSSTPYPHCRPSSFYQIFLQHLYRAMLC